MTTLSEELALAIAWSRVSSLGAAINSYGDDNDAIRKRIHNKTQMAGKLMKKSETDNHKQVHFFSCILDICASLITMALLKLETISLTFVLLR